MAGNALVAFVSLIIRKIPEGSLPFFGGSRTLLFTIVTLNTADVWPVGMTVVGGTASLDVALELRETVTFAPAAE